MDQPIPKFESPAIEQDIPKVAEEIARHKESPELRTAGGQEILKQSLRTLTPAPVPQPSDDKGSVIADPLPDYAANASPETKIEVEHLLELAFKEGIIVANAKAATSNPFVLDTFHDALVGKLYPELKKRGILE